MMPLAGHRVAALGHLQRKDDLSAAVTELLERKPEFTAGFARERLFYVDPSGVWRDDD